MPPAGPVHGQLDTLAITLNDIAGALVNGHGNALVASEATREVVAFPSGLPGFETSREFVVVSTPEMGVFSLLQSTDGVVSIPVVDPRRVLPDFRCVLGQTDQSRLQVAPDTVLLWLSIVTFEPNEQALVNLRAPIVINRERMLGYQVMPHNSLYPIRHPLTSE